MIRNIIFDIGNVLAAFQWEVRFRQFTDSDEVLERLAAATVHSPVWNELDRGLMSHEELMQAFSANDPVLEPLIRRCMAEYTGMIRMYDYSVPWIRALKAAGYGVYYLSNMNWFALRDCMDEMAFTREMDGGIMSCEEGLIKPDQAIFRLLFDRFRLTPEECVFLDDSEVNIRAAKAAGMKGIVFRDKAQAEEAMRELGIGTSQGPL